MGTVILDTSKTVATEMEIKKIKYMNYVPIVVATDLEVHFSVLKKGVSQYFCLYSVSYGVIYRVVDGDAMKRNGVRAKPLIFVKVTYLLDMHKNM